MRNQAPRPVRFTIGRAEDNDLRLDDLSVSGHHALLDFEDGKLIVTDRHSSNGTWRITPDGRAVALDQAHVTSLDTLRFGQVEVSVRSLIQAIRDLSLDEGGGGGGERGHGSGSESGGSSEPRVAGRDLVRADCGHVTRAGEPCPQCGR